MRTTPNPLIASRLLALAVITLLAAALTACEEDDAKKKSDSQAAPYSLLGIADPDFDIDGFNSSDNLTYGGMDMGESVAIQSDGKIIVAGVTYQGAFGNDMLLVRFNANGTLDTGFGTGGRINFNFSNFDDAAHGVALQADGKIIVVGEVQVTTAPLDIDMAVWRFNADGTLDTTFNGTGLVTRDGDGGTANARDAAWAVAIDSSGRIVVGGEVDSTGFPDAAVWRFLSDGSIDSVNFNSPAGFLVTNLPDRDAAYAVTTDAAGSIYLAGRTLLGPQFMAVWKVSAGGVYDSTFGGNTGFWGVAVPNASADVGRSIQLDSAGNIVVAGISTTISPNDTTAVWRILPGGTTDYSFGGTGYVTAGGAGDRRAWAATLDSNGRIYVVGEGPGNGQDLMVWRFLPNGDLDPTFDAFLGFGYLVSDPPAGGWDSGQCCTFGDVGRTIVIDKAGRLVVAGHSEQVSGLDLAVWRFK